MILVDTSVIINYLKGIENTKAMILEQIIEKKIPYGIASYTYQEVLQGARDEIEFYKLKMYLSTQTVYFLPEEICVYDEAAELYFSLRRKGITIRSIIDINIALIAVKNKLYLLHDDADFSRITKEFYDLKILEASLL